MEKIFARLLQREFTYNFQALGNGFISISSDDSVVREIKREIKVSVVKEILVVVFFVVVVVTR